MRIFKVNRDTPNGHKEGELVSELRLPRSVIDAGLGDGALSEIDPGSVQLLSSDAKSPAKPVPSPATSAAQEPPAKPVSKSPAPTPAKSPLVPPPE